MSGPRQHYLPQFLLRGFASHSVGKAVYTWVYRPNAAPFNPNVINVGVEGKFYEVDAQNEADTAITAVEGELGQIVDTVRRVRATDEVPAASFGRLFAHLEARTRHFRVGFSRVATVLLQRTLAFASDQDAFSSFVLRRFGRDPETILQPLRQDLSRRGLSPTQATELLNAVRPQLDKLLPELLPSLLKDVGASLAPLLAQHESMVKAAAHSGHVHALRKMQIPEKKAHQYAQFEFRVVQLTAPALPLGDSAIVARVDSPRRFTTFVDKGDCLRALYLPLEPNLLLCGLPPSAEPEIEALPEAIARCSMDYFVAQEKSEVFAALQGRIGELAYLMDDAAVESLLDEILEA